MKTTIKNAKIYTCAEKMPWAEAISFEDEQKTVSELKISKNMTISIMLSLRRGFEKPTPIDIIPENLSISQITSTFLNLPQIFICKEHQEKTTHYCRTCQKLICGYDFISEEDFENQRNGSFLFFCIFFFFFINF